MRAFSARLLLLLHAAGALCLLAQQNWAGLQGTVTDPTGAAVPDAQIIVHVAGLPRPLSVSTGYNGFYSLDVLPLGPAAVSVIAPGFHPIRLHSLELKLGTRTTLNVRLTLGSVIESVDVNETSAMLDVSSAQTSTTITIGEFDHLPRGRGFQTILLLAPGVRNEAKAGAAPGGSTSVDGASGSENAYFIDGVDVSDVFSGALRIQDALPFEFIKQVQVQSGGFEAEFGGVTGGVVNVATRSGTPDFHADIQLQGLFSGLNASDRGYYQRSPLDPSQAEFFVPKKDDYRVLFPGISVGGPLVRNRTFMFLGFMPEIDTTRRAIDYSGTARTFALDRIRHQAIGRIDQSVSSTLRMHASWMWAPSRRTGSLPLRDPRIQAPETDLSQIGEYIPSQTLSTALTYSPDSRSLIHVRYGYKYLNGRTGNLGVAPYPNIVYRSPAVQGFVPAGFAGPAGQQSNPASYAVERDVRKRQTLAVDVSRVASLFGQQHMLKAGVHLGSNSSDISDGHLYGRFDIFWDDAFSRGQIAGERGRYGYYIWQDGPRHHASAKGRQQGLFVQDSWRVRPSLTLQTGVRLEREFLPPFLDEFRGIRVRNPIEFGWGDKIAPRLGFAWDIGGAGKSKLSGSYGLFYDLMKYTLAREAFGGDYWFSHVYRLDRADMRLLNLQRPEALGRHITSFDNRSLSIDESGRFTRIDPNLRPYTSREFTLAFDQQIAHRLQAGVRFTSKRLLRAIEDIGVLDENDNEIYLIGNPGFGLTRDARSPYGARTPNGANFLVPKAQRNYDAIEARVEGEIARNRIIASYTLSRLFGNYAGLANSDEAGRMEPSISRSFDLPTYYFDSSGSQEPTVGRLATDRPHLLKFFWWRDVSRRFGTTSFGATQVAMSGTPDSTTVNYLTGPTFPFGRGDLGRVPWFKQTDVNVHHTFSIRDRASLRIEATVLNALNHASVISRVTQLTRQANISGTELPLADFFAGYRVSDYVRPGSPNYNPIYGLPGGDPMDGGIVSGASRSDTTSSTLAAHPALGAYQGPRTIRLGLRFSF